MIGCTILPRLYDGADGSGRLTGCGSGCETTAAGGVLETKSALTHPVDPSLRATPNQPFAEEIATIFVPRGTDNKTLAEALGERRTLRLLAVTEPSIGAASSACSKQLFAGPAFWLVPAPHCR